MGAGHMEIDGNEMVDQLARQGSSDPSTNWNRVCPRFICKGAKGVIRGWRNYKYEEYWQSMHGKSNLRAFLKDCLLKNLEHYST